MSPMLVKLAARRAHIATLRVMALAAGLCIIGVATVLAQPSPEDVIRAFRQEVTPALSVPADEQTHYGIMIGQALEAAGIRLPDPQYVIVVDRNIKVQAAMIYWLPVGAPPTYVGASPASTGRIGQFDHFETPTGVFAHTLANPDFRAEGTKNTNGIRGYGAKGMRVYDFGWQQARRGWSKGGTSTMRLQMHATDPYWLESKLGTPQSKGCIRISASLNRLIDRMGLLDADYEFAVDLALPTWVLLPDRTPAYDAGRYLIVIETVRHERPSWSPLPKTVKEKS